MFGLPSVIDRKDPANDAFRIAVMIALPVCVLLVVFAQQFMISLQGQTFDEAPIAVREDETVEPPGIASFTLEMKSILKKVYFIENEHLFDDDAEEGAFIEDAEVLEMIDAIAVTRTQRLRAAIVAGEIGGASAARERLAKLEAEVEAGGELAADVQWFKNLYSKGTKDVPEDAKDAAISRHGWFAEVALSSGQKPGEGERHRLLSGFDRINALEGGYGCFMILATILGIALAIVALVMLVNGTLAGEFDAPAVGGPVYAEGVTIYMIAFALMIFIQVPFRGSGATGATFALALSEVMLWSLALAAFWPLLRGVRWDAFRIDMGLHTGKGVLPEIGVGILAFAAERPVLILIDIITGIIKMLASGEDEDSAVTGTSEFPLFESPIGNSWFLVWLSAASSVIWAPVVEELIIRGALYRSLHARLRWPLTVLITSIVFAIIHPYGANDMASVFVGGITFGLLREWRGSLIACITAHALHNGSIELMSISQMSILDAR